MLKKNKPDTRKNNVMAKQETQTRRLDKKLNALDSQGIKVQIYKFFNEKYREATSDLRYLENASKTRYGVVVRTVQGKLTEFKPDYRLGKELAVAQRYSEICSSLFEEWERNSDWFTKGLSNKMFVRSDLMPHRIKITGVRIERLQDISDEDCLAEGIEKEERTDGGHNYTFFDVKRERYIRERTPRDAYARLIDKICGQGTWGSNPYVWVYNFELIK